MNRENPFKKIESEEEVPVRLKEKVMSSINLAHLMADIGELFTSKMGGTATKMVAAETRKSKSSKKM